MHTVDFFFSYQILLDLYRYCSISRTFVETHKSVSLYLDYGSSESTLSTFISYAPELKSRRVSVSKVYIPTAIYRFVESPGSLAVIYGGRLSRASPLASI